MTGRSGNMLGYNVLRQLISWQNQATSPTQTASYAYNGSGERVQQSVTSSGTTTTTSYIGAYEEVSVTGGTTTTTKYYSAGLAMVVNVNGTLSYLVADTLGSVSALLTAAGGVQATELYTPYGSVRYSSGTMPTSYGYTKQRQDPSGLNYDHARYYDDSVGQFISADSAQGPNRYGYVTGNPETVTDPTGNYVGRMCPDGYCGRGGNSNPYADATPAQNAAAANRFANDGEPSGSTGGGGTKHTKPKPSYGHGVCGQDIAINSNSNCGVQQKHLQTLNDKINFDYGIGGILSAVTDVIEFESDDGNPIGQLPDLIALVADLGTALSYLTQVSSIASFLGKNLANDIQNVASVLHSISGTLRTIQAAIQAGGFGAWLAEQTWKGAGWIINSAGGLGSFVKDVAFKFLGPIAIDTISSITHNVTSQAISLQKDYNDQQAMPIDQWCTQVGHGTCSLSY